VNQPSEAETKQQIKKSQVRVVVTYFMTVACVITAIGLIAWLMCMDKSELAIGVFSGVASTAATIIAFWFGSRGPGGGSVQPSDAQGAGGGSA